MTDFSNLYAATMAGQRLDDAPALTLANEKNTHQLTQVASHLRDQGHGSLFSYSRKVFIPLTHLCRDVCHYCTFAQVPKQLKGPLKAPFLTVEEAVDIARQGALSGCKEALFTLGDQPESRYRVAREWLQEQGYATTLDYLAHVAQQVFAQTGLLPHLNPGLMSKESMLALKQVSVSMGIMLESASDRLTEKNMPHYGSIDKIPARRIETIRLAGEAAIPFTSGILIGIGETRRERIESLLVLRDLHEQYGHLQELIIQNFRAKPDTLMANSPEPDLNELIWTIAVARLIFGPAMNLQAPPNLSPGVLPQLVNAGINDWGGVSPVTPDFVNPEAPWPHLTQLAQETKKAGKLLLERLAIYPEFALKASSWTDPNMTPSVLRSIDGQGYARTDQWYAGAIQPPPDADLALINSNIIATPSDRIKHIIDKILAKSDSDQSTTVAPPTEQDLICLMEARGEDFSYLCQSADNLRQRVSGDITTYVVNRNINYTNICYFKCQFCAFSKGKTSDDLRGKPYDLSLQEIQRRSQEAWQRGATEVCLQGGIHPSYTGQTYIDICLAIKEVCPDIHIHAFSPLEVWQGAHSLNISLEAFLIRLKEAGLNTLPGTAAEILDDEVRAELCPDKINTQQWEDVMTTAHRVGFNTTATLMFGHIEQYKHVARHLLRIRSIQQAHHRFNLGNKNSTTPANNRGFTEFVLLPYVHMEAPLYRKGKSRSGPTFRESVALHAISRLVLHPYITNIQASWTKMGHIGAGACLSAGVNDLGGTLMNETITRSAGASHGQETSPEAMESIIRSAGREPQQRGTQYQQATQSQINQSFEAAPLVDPIYDTVKSTLTAKPMLIRYGDGVEATNNIDTMKTVNTTAASIDVGTVKIPVEYIDNA